MTTATERIMDVTMLAIELNEQASIRGEDRTRTISAARAMQPALADYAADYEEQQRAAWLDRLCRLGPFERVTPAPVAPAPWRVEVTELPWCNIVDAAGQYVNVDFDSVEVAQRIVDAINKEV